MITIQLRSGSASATGPKKAGPAGCGAGVEARNCGMFADRADVALVRDVLEDLQLAAEERLAEHARRRAKSWLLPGPSP